ncbi:MAG: hypothetical protein L7U64_03915 [Luminiphilus sp.]|nr:hypothetical protein [Luminiphilus sp.]
MKRHTLELFFESHMDAIAAGYPDAQPIDDDLPEVGYFALLSFECQSFEYLGADEGEELTVDLEMLA